MSPEELKVGSRVWFAEEKKPYRVRARNERFLICTKPFNPKHTVLYSIIDLQKQVRGPDNIIFGMGYESDDDIRDRMADLVAGEIEVSHRRKINLNIARIEP